MGLWMEYFIESTFKQHNLLIHNNTEVPNHRAMDLYRSIYTGLHKKN